MTWEFQIHGSNPLFVTTTSNPAPNNLHHFEADGLREYIDGNLVRRHNVMMITHGMLKITVENQNPVDYVFDDFEWDAETGEMGNTNPFPYERQVYPTGDWMDLQAGPQGCEWVCFFPHEGQKLAYQAYKGAHTYVCHDYQTYAILITGIANISGEHRYLWESVELGPNSHTTVEASDDAIVFYVWKR